MSLCKFKWIFLVLIFLSASSFTEQNDSEKIFDLRSINCKTFLDLKEQSRDYLFFFLYGFSSGMDKEFNHSVKKIEKAVETLGNTCSDKPEANVFDVLESIQ